MTEEEKRFFGVTYELDRVQRQIAATMFAPFYANKINMAKKVASLAGELLILCAEFERLDSERCANDAPTDAPTIGISGG